MPLQLRKEAPDDGAELLLSTLEKAAATTQVLWIVSGGSNIDIAVAIAKRLDQACARNIQACLADERFGQLGHADSNYQKLVVAGWPLDKINLVPVLMDGADLEITARNYAQAIEQLFSSSDIIIAQLGIGADGHTAGVLPHSVAVESSKPVDFYKGPDFDRITLTLRALAQVHVAFVFAYGPDKQAALADLSTHETSLAEAPCQILKQIPSCNVYNDQVEGGSA